MSGQEFVTVKLGAEWFAAPVQRVHDVLDTSRIYPVPLARPDVAGSINLRGHIVTVIDLRVRLGEAERPARAGTCLIVDRSNDPSGEIYALLVDQAGEVRRLSYDLYEESPVTLAPLWRACAPGVFRVDGQLLLLLDIDAALGWDPISARLCQEDARAMA